LQGCTEGAITNLAGDVPHILLVNQSSDYSMPTYRDEYPVVEINLINIYCFEINQNCLGALF